MQFNITLQPLGQALFNITQQVEAPDIAAALEAAKAPMVDQAKKTAASLVAALGDAPQAVAELLPR